MSTHLIERIREKLGKTEGLDATARDELVSLLEALKEELTGMDEDRAESIAGFTVAAAHEAIRSERNPDLLKLAVDGLSESVKEIENEHPQAVELVNGLCTMLANLGI